MRFCVGDEPECNGPECGHAETCPYYLSAMKDDSSLKEQLDDWTRNNKGVNRGTPTETERAVSRALGYLVLLKERQNSGTVPNLDEEERKKQAKEGEKREKGTG